MDYQLPQKNSTTKTSDHNLILPTLPTCTNCSSSSTCFFCIMSETVPNSLRREKLTRYFKQMPHTDGQEHILALSGLWKIAITKPNDPEFPSLGIFRCMAKLIQKSITHKEWLLKFQNIYIPYYAAHIIGSYTMNKAKFADKAVKSNVVQPLMELLRGKISWVEQRVALRALGHLASHEETFEAVAAEHEAEITEAAIHIASTCLNEVYEKFVFLKESERLEYHRNLLTRGRGDLELENRKAEEWASQLQCWSLYLLDCFACRERSLTLICNKKQFLKDLCGMWGGMSNPNSPSGIGLVRTLCHTQIGRESVAELKEVIVSLCNVSRSSDDRQHMAIESLLQLLRDPVTRYKVMDIAAPVLADLVELRGMKGRLKVGQEIMQTLLQDFHKIKFCKLNLKSERTKRTLEELWDLKVDRVKRESLMSEQEMREREVLAGVLKKEGNREFLSGEVEKAVMKYTEALDLCPLRVRRERIVIHSNRAQCHLLLRDPEAALSDTTRALCLSSSVTCLHVKSLWRRSQAYDMKGVARESLMDCLMFIRKRFGSRGTKGLPYCVTRMINKQMNATWLFSSARSSWHSTHEEEPKEFMVQNKFGALNLRKKTRRIAKGEFLLTV